MVVWTRTEEDGDGLATYRLVARTPDGVVRDLPLRGFRHQVDADLGPAADGGLVAVYDRCRVGACDVWRYSFATGRERRVRSVSTRRRAESAASSWEGGFGFLRYAVTIGFHAGFRGAGVYTGRPARRASRQFADQTDTQGAVTAFSAGSRRAPSATTRVSVIRGRRRVCPVAVEDKEPGGQGFRVREAVLSGPHLYWLHTVVRPDGSELAALHRVPVPGRRCRDRGPVEQHRFPLPLGTRHLAVDGERVYVTSPAGVEEVESPAFAPLAR
jgi:hypothetical protein